MGEAKRRGNFEQRKEAALRREAAEVIAQLQRDRERERAERQRRARLTPKQRRREDARTQLFVALQGMLAGSRMSRERHFRPRIDESDPIAQELSRLRLL